MNAFPATLATSPEDQNIDGPPPILAGQPIPSIPLSNLLKRHP
jgi:hypothetical protein